MPYQEGGPIVASRMEPAMTPSAAVKRRLLVVLALVAAGLVVAYLVGVHGPHAKSLLSDLALAVVLAVSGLVVLRAAAGPERDPRRPLGLLLLLSALIHVVFLVHGLQKLFVTGITGVAGFLTQMGVPLPMTVAFETYFGGLAAFP